MAIFGSQVAIFGSQVARVGSKWLELGSKWLESNPKWLKFWSQVARVGSEVDRVGSQVARVGSQWARVRSYVARVGSQVARVESQVTSVGSQVSRVGCQVLLKQSLLVLYNCVPLLSQVLNLRQLLLLEEQNQSHVRLTQIPSYQELIKALKSLLLPLHCLRIKQTLLIIRMMMMTQQVYVASHLPTQMQGCQF